MESQVENLSLEELKEQNEHLKDLLFELEENLKAAEDQNHYFKLMQEYRDKYFKIRDGIISPKRKRLSIPEKLIHVTMVGFGITFAETLASYWAMQQAGWVYIVLFLSFSVFNGFLFSEALENLENKV